MVEPVDQAAVQARLAVVLLEGGASQEAEDQGRRRKAEEGPALAAVSRADPDRREESVPSTGQGLEIHGRPSGVTERHADPADAEVEAAIEIHVGVTTPDRASELIPRHQLAGTSREELEHPSGLILELDPLAAPEELPVSGWNWNSPNLRTGRAIREAYFDRMICSRGI